MKSSNLISKTVGRAFVGTLPALAMLATTQPAVASDEDVCTALEAMFVRLDEKLTEWQAAGRADRMSVIRLNSKVALARAFAGDNDWPDPFVETLASMGIVGLDEADPPLGNEEIPAFMVSQAQIILETAQTKCPNSEFIDISRFAE